MVRRVIRIGSLGALVAVLGVLAGARLARAQSDAGTGTLPPARIAGLGDAPPYAPMEFSRAWLGKVERVRRARQELLAAGKLDGMEPAAAAQLGAALTGTLRVLVVPVLYADEPAPFSKEELAARLFGGPRGDTVSYSSYFDEVSDGLLRVTGSVTSWVRLPHGASYYLPADEYGWGRFGRVKELREQALARIEPSVDLGLFDNDGPDGIPNSGDDDGYADFVVFMYALPCGATADVHSGAIWPHRGAMKPYPTHYAARSGGTIKITDYLILPAVDPRTCGPLQVGVLAHETGHVLGLPDLYDYNGGAQGIGAWGLMGTGSHSAPWSPAHFSAWSKEQLGWVKEVWLHRDTTGLRVPPVETSHTVYRYDLPGTAGEYLLFENRQKLGSDKALPGHGVLAWHVDPERGELGMWNSDERRPAVAVLDAEPGEDPFHSRPADASDPYPGQGGHREFEYLQPAGFRLSGISEWRGDVYADVRVPTALASGVSERAPALMRLAAPQGASPVARVLRVAALRPARDWTARGMASWLHARRSGDELVVSADPASLPPGAYQDTLSLGNASDTSFARKVVVALEVSAPGSAEVVATGLPWSWGLAADNGRMLQAGYGWDPLGLRPRPRVLVLDRTDPISRTLVRIPADALYAPVVTDKGEAYVVARAQGENLVYRVDEDGSAAFVARLGAGAPAYGTAALPDGSIAVADWSGEIRRVTAAGAVASFARLPEHLYQIASDSAGAIIAAGYEGDALRLEPGGGFARLVTGFGTGRLVAVAADPAGNAYVAERGGQGRIMRFAPDGHVAWTISVPGAHFYGLAVEGSFLYALDLGHRQLLRMPLSGTAAKAPPAGAIPAPPPASNAQGR